jgi:phosphopantothenoylcysteine decarboxylase/phosphopantothenate--cysteine ligase
MMQLKGKKVLVGITGSIAAYKSAMLIRLLIRAGADVKVIMTECAKEFISELTISVLSKHTVHTELFHDGSWDNHVELGLWADVFIVAPATANTLGKMAHGLSDNMLVASYLSAKCPTFIAPAMDLDMWKHPSTKNNLDKLKSYGNHIIKVGEGELASGLYGEGRMAEPEVIVKQLVTFFNFRQDMIGKKVMVTAGPTHEHIDPVRFMGNNSSGKMGIAIADELCTRGAEVHLILGPSKLKPDSDTVHLYKVTSADEMYKHSVELFPDMDMAIMTAAVADYKPFKISSTKIKKSSSEMHIELVKNQDIAQHIGQLKKDNQLTIGFALETNNAVENAKKKVKKKNFDFIVLNTLEDKGAGFDVDTNKVKFIMKNGDVIDFKLKSKAEVAKDIVNHITTLF